MEGLQYTEKASDAMIDLINWVTENTGLRGEETSGSVNLNVSGTTLMITANRGALDTDSALLSHIEDDPRYKIKYIGVHSVAGGDKRPHLEIVEREYNPVIERLDELQRNYSVESDEFADISQTIHYLRQSE